MDKVNQAIRGRGAAHNPGNRFELYCFEEDPARVEPACDSVATEIYRDRTESLITYNDSPDEGFSASINPYRGCEHGCIYLYAQPKRTNLENRTVLIIQPCGGRWSCSIGPGSFGGAA